MTSDSPEAIPAAEGVEDFPNLYPRQTSLGIYRVLHIKEDDTSTHYKVDINAGECECRDFQQRQKGNSGQTCKHLAAALFHAKRHISVEQQAVSNLAGILRDARSSADELERIATGVKADISHAAAESPSDDADDEPDVDPVDAVAEWIEGEGVPLEKVDVWMEGNSVQIESKEQLEDDEFAVLRDTEWIWYDGEENRNFVTEDNLAEVV